MRYNAGIPTGSDAMKSFDAFYKGKKIVVQAESCWQARQVAATELRVSILEQKKIMVAPTAK